MEKKITFFYTDHLEKNTWNNLKRKATERGFKTEFSKDLTKNAEIGFYNHDRNIKNKAKLSVISIHGMDQCRNLWPNPWINMRWDYYDVGLLPGKRWSRMWSKASFDPYAVPKKGVFNKNNFYLEDVTKLNINDNNYYKYKNEIIDLNFNKSDIIDAISNYKIIPFYKYHSHVKNLKKFDLYSNEVSLYYISELLKPLFLIIISFVVMGFSSQFRRNENFFKVLFISVLIGFVIFLFKIIVFNFTGKSNINFIYSYLVILIMPSLLGLYQVVKIERN